MNVKDNLKIYFSYQNIGYKYCLNTSDCHFNFLSTDLLLFGVLKIKI